jgi:mRNA-degrading endonuclease toxin of MazEF toxin-antitoxin module
VRGDLYRLRPAKDAAGHEQRGPRYAVAIQSDAILLSTLIVAPTSGPSSVSRAALSPDRVLATIIGALQARQTGARHRLR